MKNDKKLQPPYIPDVNIRNVKEMAAKADQRFVDTIRDLEEKSEFSNSLDNSKESFSWASFGELVDAGEDSL